MAYGSIEEIKEKGLAVSSPREALGRPWPRRLGVLWLVGVACASAYLLSDSLDAPSSSSSKKSPIDAPVLALAKDGRQNGTNSTLSQRGQGIKAVRDDIPLFMAGLADPYEPTTNPQGYLVMLVAENKLMWKEMAQKLQEVQSSSPLPERIFTYGTMTGQQDFIHAMANVFSKWIKEPAVDPKYVKTQAGAGSVLAQISYLLGDTNDGVLVTAPNYPAFPGDFGVYGGMKLHTVQTTASTKFVPTVADLDQVYAEAVEANHPPKILIICQPNNPTGTVYSKEAMHTMIEWALEKNLHVVSDEIYALSVFPGYETTSAATVMYERNPNEDRYLGDRVHIVAGLSKDWGMSGFRVGTLFSHNEQLLSALELIGYYPSVSQYTQHALTQVFSDHVWIDWYIAENQRRLAATYKGLVEALDRVNVLVYPAEGALFAWADFSSLLLDGQSEKELWLELFHDAKVIFTLGGSCNEDSLAMFRIVYPWPEGGPIAMKELGDRLVQWKETRKAM